MWYLLTGCSTWQKTLPSKELSWLFQPTQRGKVSYQKKILRNLDWCLVLGFTSNELLGGCRTSKLSLSIIFVKWKSDCQVTCEDKIVLVVAANVDTNDAILWDRSETGSDQWTFYCYCLYHCVQDQSFRMWLSMFQLNMDWCDWSLNYWWYPCYQVMSSRMNFSFPLSCVECHYILNPLIDNNQ